jgi:hypothetical protein
MSTATATISLDQIRRAVRAFERAADGYRPMEPEEFVAAMREYCRVAEYVNERLHEAHHLLRQNSRSDAINAVEAEPNALDSLNELDAVDAKVQVWAEVCDSLNIPRPPQLLTDLAAELNAEYDSKHQLATAMRTHRLLALAGAPLEQRVTNLRRMLQLDAGNRFWEQDLVQYERECQARLEREIDSLGKDLAAGITPAAFTRIKFVVAQLASPDWRDPVDAAIVRRAQRIQQKAEAARARARVEELTGLLNAAVEKADLDRAAGLAQEWYALVAELEVADDDSAVVETEQAREWVRTEVNHRAARNDFESAMQALSGLVHQRTGLIAPRAGRALRDKVVNAAQAVRISASRLEDAPDIGAWLEAASQRTRGIDRGIQVWFFTTAILIVGAVVGIGSTAFLVSRSLTRSRVIEKLNGRLAAARDAGKTADVSQIWEQETAKHPWLVKSSAFVGIEDEIEKNRQRAAEALESAQASIEQANQSLAAGDAAIDAFEQVREIGTDADRLRSDARARIQDVGEHRDRAEGHIKSLRDAGEDVPSALNNAVKDASVQQRRRFQKLGELSESLRRSREEDIATAIRELTKRKGDLAENSGDAIQEIEGDIEAVERFADVKLAALRAELEGVKARVRHAMNLQEWRHDLDVAAAQGVNQLLDQLRRLKDQLPAEYANDVDQVVSSKDCIDAALAWSGVARDWHADVTGPVATMKKWHDAFAHASGLPRPYADSDAIKTRMESLGECVRQMGEDPAPEIAALEELVQADVLKDDVVEVRVEVRGSETALYTVEKQKTVQEKYYPFYKDEVTLDRRTLEPNKMVFEAIQDRNFSRARHVPLASQLRSHLVGIKKGEVALEDQLVQLMAVVLEDAGDADVLLRAKAMIMLCDLARSRSFLCESKAIERLSDELGAKIGDIGAKWVLANEPTTGIPQLEGERRAAKAVFDQASQWKRDINTDVERRRKELGVRPEFCKRIEFVGWAYLGEGEVSLSRVKTRVEDIEGPLYFVRKKESSTGAPWELVSCGEMRRLGVTLQKVGGLNFGTPIFVEVSAPVRSKSRREK